MISKILVPTDGSKPAKKSIEYAVHFAEQVGATIVLLSVMDRSLVLPQTIPVSPNATKLIEPLADYLKRAAGAYLDEAEELCRKFGVQSKKVLRSGHPVEEIVKEAQKSRVDLIIIGSHGRSALKAAVLGSVTFGIINKEIKVPVLVVRK
jgi:nucleotide-binding universal stress UspA family protein